MNKKFLIAVSVAALMAASPAMATDQNTGSNHNPQRNLATVPSVTEGDIERGIEDAGNSLTKAINNVTGTDGKAAAAPETYENIRGALIDNGAAAKNFTYITIDSRNTVAGMIGKDVRNNNGGALAKIEDIILDRKGNAMLVVVANGGFMGLGEKKAAFEYDIITKQNADGDVITPLSEASIKNAAVFSYEPKAEKGVRVIPSGGYSAAQLLKTEVVDNTGAKVAHVRDIALSGGKASRVIVAYNDVMGVGGDNAVLFFDQMKLAQKDGKLEFQLPAAQSLTFDRFKATTVGSSN